MRARCRCPHITHYSLSRLINEIKNASHTAFESCFRGWLVGGNACTDRHQTLFPWPKGQTMVKGCQSCESASLSLLLSILWSPSSSERKGERMRERRERERERETLGSGCSNMTFHTGIYHSNRWHLSYFSSRQTGFLTAWLLLVAVDVPAEISITGSSDLGTLGWL